MDHSNYVEKNIGYKCGEIYVSNDIYTYQCSFCSYNHRNIKTLKTHINLKHRKYFDNNTTNKYSSNESIFNKEDYKLTIESEHIERYSDLELEDELDSSNTKEINIDIVTNQTEFEIVEDLKILTQNDNQKLNTYEFEQITNQSENLNKSKPEWTKCNICNCRMFKQSLPNHINKFHSEYFKLRREYDIINEFLCRFCSTSFSTIDEIYEHETKCDSGDYRKCNDCGNFIHKNKLDLHMEEMHNIFGTTEKSISTEDSFHCKVCNKKFTNKLSTVQHENECFSINEYIICTYCDCCLLKQDLKEHLTNIHPEQFNLELSDYEKSNLDDYDIYDNSTNKVEDLKIEILFDTNTDENLENSIISSPLSLSPVVKDDWQINQSIITKSQTRQLIIDKHSSEMIKSRNIRKLCTKCNRVSNDIQRHRKICSQKREWATCMYCGCHMFKDRLEQHLNKKHSVKISQENNEKTIKKFIKTDYDSNDDDDDDDDIFNNDDRSQNANKNIYSNNNVDKLKKMNNNKSKPCRHCGRFVVKIMQHESSCIQSKNRFTCEICGKHVFQRNMLKHMELHNHLNIENLAKTIKTTNSKCRYCNRNFSTRWGSLERHEKYCSNLMNREKCKYCKYFVSKINMEKHILNKHMDKDGNIQNVLSTNYENFSEMDYNKLPCRYCNKLYLKPVAHEKHCQLRAGHKNEWTRCQICSSLVLRSRLSIHMKKIHQIITDDMGNDIENQHTDNIKTEFVKCILCGCHIRLKNFQYHIFRIHKDRLPIKEHEILDYNKLSSYDLTQFRTATIFSEWIKCKECGLMVAEPTLKSHLEIHEKFGNLRGTNFQCNICKKKYPARRYQQHIRTAHLDENNSVFCNECDLKRIHNDYYDDHMKWHSGEIIGYNCNICNRRYELKYNLDRHMKTHEEKPSCNCPQCGKIFTNKLRLNQHIQIHSTDAKYQCDTCGKAFIIKSRLISHQLTHTDKKFYRFPCTICNKRFCSKAKLADHMITHTRTKNFKCDICDAKFARKFDAIKHQRRHTEVGHLMCSICTKRFFLKRPLKDHLKSQHGVLDENAIIDTRVQLDKSNADTVNYENEMLEEIDDQTKVATEAIGDYEIIMEFDE